MGQYRQYRLTSALSTNTVCMGQYRQNRPVLGQYRQYLSVWASIDQRPILPISTPIFPISATRMLPAWRSEAIAWRYDTWPYHGDTAIRYCTAKGPDSYDIAYHVISSEVISYNLISNNIISVDMIYYDMISDPRLWPRQHTKWLWILQETWRFILLKWLHKKNTKSRNRIDRVVM